jgi:hypothetical protein
MASNKHPVKRVKKNTFISSSTKDILSNAWECLKAYFIAGSSPYELSSSSNLNSPMWNQARPRLYNISKNESAHISILRNIRNLKHYKILPIEIFHDNNMELLTTTRTFGVQLLQQGLNSLIPERTQTIMG